MIFPAYLMRGARVLLMSLVVTACVGLSAAEPVIEGTLPEDILPELKGFLATAMNRSPQMISKEIELAQSEASRYFSVAAQRPQVNGNVNYNTNYASTEGGPANKASALGYSFTANQALYAWNALANQTKIADIGIKMAQRSYAEAYRALANAVRQQYLALIYKKIAIRNLRYNLNLTERFLVLDEERFKNGSLSSADMILPRRNAALARLSMARSDEDYAQAKRQFAHLVGLESISDDAIPLETPKWMATAEVAASLLARYQRDGVESTFQGQVNAMLIKRTELEYKIAKVRLYPKLNATATASQSNNQDVLPGSGSTPGVVRQTNSQNYGYGVAASWAIFDGGSAKGAKLSALASKRSYELEKKKLAEATLDQAQSMVRTLGFTVQAMEFTEFAQVSAAANVQRMADEFKRGNVAQQAIDTATAQLYDSEAGVAAGRNDLLMRWCEFVSLVGADPILNTIPSRYVR